MSEPTFTERDVLLLADIADGFSTVDHYDRIDEFRKRLAAHVRQGRAPDSGRGAPTAQRVDKGGVRLVRTGMPERVVMGDIAEAIKKHDLTFDELCAIVDEQRAHSGRGTGEGPSDAQRLDWLGEHISADEIAQRSDGTWRVGYYVDSEWAEASGPTLRAAIDTAMSAASPSQSDTPEPPSLGAVGEPHGPDHAVRGRSEHTVCAATIRPNWLGVRGLFTPATFAAMDNACEACVAVLNLPCNLPELPSRSTLTEERR